MAFTKGSYPPLTGGVSQQVVHARLPNQVTEQVNMLSDLVTGPRRRGGTRLIRELNVSNSVVTEVVNLRGVDTLIAVEYDTGRVQVYTLCKNSNLLLDSTSDYLKANSGRSIRFTQHSNDIYILNVEQVVQAGESHSEVNVDPTLQGYFYTNTGALGTTYDVIVDVAGVSYSVTHATPASDATKATPEFISTQLVTKLKAHAVVGTAQGYTWSQLGPYVYVKAPVPIRITTGMGSHMLQVSNSSNVYNTSVLPAKLPVEANGYIVRIGYGTASQYFSWDYSDSAWKERAAWGQTGGIDNLPVYIDSTLLELRTIDMAGRLAGDIENSPDPYFVGKKLTGLGSFQGRLLFLCGEYLTFTASNNPRRVYRASTTLVADDDPIEIASTTTLGVVYEYALPYNGDLLITSENVQGIVPGRSVLTPKSAVISIASQYKMQAGVMPTSTGKTMLYPAYASQGSSAIWEMTPSEYTEQQIQSHNITEHLPRFIKGNVLSITTSSTSGIAVILDETNVLKVHQYLWDGSEKRHTAFHTWEMRETILNVHSQVNLLYIIAKSTTGNIRILEWDVVNGLGDEWKRIPKLDSYTVAKPEEGVIRIPDWMYSLEDLESGIVIAYSETEYGTPFSFTITDWRVDGEEYVGTSQYFTEADVTLGYTYSSSLTPSPPVIRDYQGTPILTERAVLHSVTAMFSKTGSIMVDVTDRAREYPAMEYTPLRMYSNNLDAGEPLATLGNVNIPMRTDMASTEFTIRTNDIYDMNITAMEYGYRHNQRGRRAYAGGN